MSRQRIHGVEEVEAYRHGLKQAIGRVRAGLTDVVVFGVEPTAVAADYGWMTPTVPAGLARGTFQPVAGFVEKPPLSQALDLFSSGAVWNTMLLVAKAKALLARYHQHLPFLAGVLPRVADLRVEACETFLQDWYPRLPSHDFSRDLLTPSRPLWLYTWPSTIGWSDLGTPERLEEWQSIQRSRVHRVAGVDITGVECVAS